MALAPTTVSFVEVTQTREIEREVLVRLLL